MEWTKEEVLNYINTNRFFASYKLNRIFIGPLIYTNPPLPGEIGLLPYTTSHSQPAQQPAQQQYNPQQLGQQQYTLQQNGSTECSRGVAVPKEELDKTSKEEPDKTPREELDKTSKEGIIDTSDEDETQVDSGNRQVDSGGNRQVDSGGN